MIKALLLLLVLFLSACAGIGKLSLNSVMAPMLGEASLEMEREANWETFRHAILANTKFIEGLIYLAPNSRPLLASALKANSGYAFGVLEALWMGDQWKRPSRKRYLNLALRHYSKAIYWGMRYLELQGISYKQLMGAQRDNRLMELLNEKLNGDEDLEAVFFLAQGLGSYANLQKTSPIIIAQLPLAKGLFDWVCALRPNIRHGACEMFYGAWESGRPKMLGGNLAKGKKYFTDAIAKYPENYLVRTTFLRFYVIPTKDKKEYQRQKAFLQKAFRKWQKKFFWRPSSKDSYQDNGNLYNAIAKKQFAMMVKNEQFIF